MEIAGNIYGDWRVIDRDLDRNWNCECTVCGAKKSIHEYSLMHRTPKCNHMVANNSLIGKHFSDWEVIGIVSSTKLLCKCSCGKIKEVNKYTVMQGRSTNCGHLKNKDRVIDLTGRKFNSLKVIRYLGDQYWECECSCGKICKKHRNHLLDGRAKDCGHSRDTGFINIKDQRFGMLVAKEYVGDKNWLCKCDCGNEKIIAGANLRNHSTVSCGCINKHIDETEIVDFCTEFRDKNDRLPFIDEIAEHFKVGNRQMWYFIHTREVEQYVNNSFSSKAERDIADIFKSLDDVILGDRTTISPYELDIHLVNHKVAIEYNGSFWHSDKLKDRLYHQNKTISCAKKGIQLIHIFEYEWEDENKQRKIKEFLHDRIFGTQKIYARNTVVKEVTKDESKEFIEKYHLQGDIHSNIRVGCFLNNELVGIMTFGDPRFGNTEEYELLRMCFKSGISVIGGVQKMFKYFIEKYNPKSIVTYADITKFKGNCYTCIGFKVVKITDPNYVWYNNNNTRDIKSRYQTQKSRLIELGLGSEDQTEDEIMTELEYTKIYDSGSLKLLWEANKECLVEANLQ